MQRQHAIQIEKDCLYQLYRTVQPSFFLTVTLILCVAAAICCYFFKVRSYLLFPLNMMTYSQILIAPIPERSTITQGNRLPRDKNPAEEVDERDGRMDVSMNGRIGSSMSPPKIKYESTPDGDVRTFVVEPSFDSDEANKRERGNHSAGHKDCSVIESRQRSMVTMKRTHTRDLSAHFFDATRLNEVLDVVEPGNICPEQYSRSFDEPKLVPIHSEVSAMSLHNGGAPPVSPAGKIGQKHRRRYSGDVSNPVMAHRRINSIGNSTAVDRRYYFGGHTGSFQHPATRPAYGHRREDSTGLDILSAAANVSKEELAMAAGRPAPTVTWDHPPESVRQTEGQRMSPSAVSAASYEYPRASYPNRPYHPHYHGSSHHTGTYAPYQAFYPPGGPPPSAYHFHPPSGPTYPSQYVPPRGSDQYSKLLYPPQQTSASKNYREGDSRRDERIDTDEPLFDHPQVHSWTAPRNTGAQTFATLVGVGEGNRAIRPSLLRRTMGANPELDYGSKPAIPSGVGHHRKLSSYSSIGTLMNSALFPETSELATAAGVNDRKIGGHHRATSSSVSFLQGLEDDGDLFLQNLGPPPVSSFQTPFSPPSTKMDSTTQPMETKSSVSVVSTTQGSGRSLAEGGTSKRVRRKCTIDNCPNRVVQGGLCISHGAKRKTCTHHGCNKNVKKAGLCSTHGPARKRCGVGGCGKVAVQGGRCIAHGAKKKPCAMEGCSKQAILNGMCKKHHDLSQGIVNVCSDHGQEGDYDEEEMTCVESKDKLSARSPKALKPSHHRGLSIFQEISAESVQTLLSHDEETDSGHPLM